MENFKASKKNIENFNSGYRYVNYESSPDAEDFNNVIESQLYVQGLAEQPDISGVNNVGVPSVSIRQREDGSAQLVFKNLKGQKGDSGIADAKLSNDYGKSTVDGYTQAAINSMAIRPNLLINGHFHINQRGQTTYNNPRQYTVDRWIQIGNGKVQYNNLLGVRLEVVDASQGSFGIFQSINDWKTLASYRNVTFSVKINAAINVTDKFFIGIGFSENAHSLGTIKKISEYQTPVNGQTYYINYSITEEIFNQANNLKMNCFVGFSTGAKTGEVISIESAKLEFGIIPTIAHEKRYDEELRDCRYYYRRYVASSSSSGVFFTGMNRSATEAYFAFDVTIRRPTINVNGNVAILDSKGRHPITSLELQTYEGSSTVVIKATSSDLSPFDACALIKNEDESAYIEFDGEIY